MQRRLWIVGGCLLALAWTPGASAPPDPKAPKPSKPSKAALKKAATVDVDGLSKRCFDDAAAKKRSKEGMYRQYEGRFMGAALLAADITRQTTENYWGRRTDTWIAKVRARTAEQFEPTLKVNNALTGQPNIGNVFDLCEAVALRDPKRCRIPRDEAGRIRCRMTAILYAGDASQCGLAGPYEGVCRSIFAGPKAPCVGAKAPCANLEMARKSIMSYCAAPVGNKGSDARCLGGALIRAKLGVANACQEIPGRPTLRAVCEGAIKGKRAACASLGKRMRGDTKARRFLTAADGMVTFGRKRPELVLLIDATSPSLCRVKASVTGPKGAKIYSVDKVVRVPDKPEDSDLVMTLGLADGTDPWTSKVKVQAACTPRYWW